MTRVEAIAVLERAAHGADEQVASAIALAVEALSMPPPLTRAIARVIPERAIHKPLAKAAARIEGDICPDCLRDLEGPELRCPDAVAGRWMCGRRGGGTLPARKLHGRSA